jgi:nucleotide-binding universal stress UspA family protein
MITIKNILVATDFSEPSDAALIYGRELARQFSATLHVFHAVENIYITTLGAENFANVAGNLQQEVEDEARRRLNELLKSKPNEPPTIAAVLTSASPAYAIVDYAKTHDIDAIVVGTHGRSGLAHVFLGSVA